LNQKETKTFAQLISISSCTKLADLLISAKTTLPWLVNSLGAPAWIISLLVPIRESGSLIPQWPLKQRTQHIENRVLIWRWGIVVQGFAIGMLLFTATLTRGLTAGIGVLGALLLFSLGRALTSLSIKDIQGLNVEKGRRGKLVGLSSSVSGLLSLLSAGLLMIADSSSSDISIQIMLGFSAALFFFCLILSSGLQANILDNEKPQHQENKLWLAISNNDDLKNLIISRCLLLHGALIAPYFVVNSTSNNDVFQLPYFIIASALASFLSSYLWGKMADKNAVKTLFFAALVCLVASISFYLTRSINLWLLDVSLFFALNLGYAGVRTGRTTYILDIAQGSQRTLYVAAANTTVGYILLGLGALYALLTIWLSEHIIGLMSLLLVIGMLHTIKMKVEK
jgi:MFS family permease